VSPFIVKFWKSGTKRDQIGSELNNTVKVPVTLIVSFHLLSRFSIFSPTRHISERSVTISTTNKMLLHFTRQ